MVNKKSILTDDQIITEANLTSNPKSISRSSFTSSLIASSDDSDGGSDSSDSYSSTSLKLKSTFSVVNGEGSDGDTDGSESDGEDARF